MIHNTSHVDEHEAFAASRSSDYVFVPPRSFYYEQLDHHADISDGDSKLPLVVCGDSGNGKSALLANWVKRRRVTKNKDEFLFQHFVGSSTESVQLRHMLRRLETALKDFYQLREMEVPTNEERLRWSLQRFISAAAKKHYPTRIVIVIDGINRLKGEEMQDGALHWLPSELPPGVRFIVSTVEFDYSVQPIHEEDLNVYDSSSSSNSSSKQASSTSDSSKESGGEEHLPYHRTYLNLLRRSCPVLKLEPLGVNTRHSIINSFKDAYPEDIILSEEQQFRIVTSIASSQPMFLRILLHGIKWLGETIYSPSEDKKNEYNNYIDSLLGSTNSFELVSTLWDIASDYISKQGGEEALLGKVLTVIYVSRNGLSNDEVWGSVQMASRAFFEDDVKAIVDRILQDYTMVVGGLKSFSHQVYKSVIFEKYVKTPEAHIKWHRLMSQFFDTLHACERKLTSIVYHLEVSGSWKKLKNALTDISMFNLWWTATFKPEFMKLWTSLTNRLAFEKNNERKKRKQENFTKERKNEKKGEEDEDGMNSFVLVTGEFDEYTMRWKQKPRPYYDMVEEYTRSLQEYKNKVHPSDEELSDIILKIAEFFLEYATLGFEELADVPQLIHPQPPIEDMASLGVPFLSYDEEGRSVINMPKLFLEGEEDKPMDAGIQQGNDDMPERSTYFFQRWIWINFPWIALANCGERYIKGIKMKEENESSFQTKSKLPSSLELSSGEELMASSKDFLLPGETKRRKKAKFERQGEELAQRDFELSKALLNRTKLPNILGAVKKKTKTRGLITEEMKKENNENMDEEIQRRIDDLRFEVQTHREEFDVLLQQRRVLEREMVEMKTDLKDLYIMEEAAREVRERLKEALKKTEKAEESARFAKLLSRNYTYLLQMCERHPAFFPGLVSEVEEKLDQDDALLEEFKQKVWEEQFEVYSHQMSYRQMKQLIHHSVNMHGKMLDMRCSIQTSLQESAVKDMKRLQTVIEKRKQRKAKLLSRASTSSSTSSLFENEHDSLYGNTSTNGSYARLHSNESNRSISSKHHPFYKSDHLDRFLTEEEFTEWHDKWTAILDRIKQKTGMPDPTLFFNRMLNSDSMIEQMKNLKVVSDFRLQELREEYERLDDELEELQYDNSMVGLPNAINNAAIHASSLPPHHHQQQQSSSSSSPSVISTSSSQIGSEQQKQLVEAKTKEKKAKERADSANELVTKVLEGLHHIGDTLNLDISPKGPVSDVLHSIEGVLEMLMEEKEKAEQQATEGANHAHLSFTSSSGSPTRTLGHGGRDSITSMDVSMQQRPTELDVIINKFESPQTRLASKLPFHVSEKKVPSPSYVYGKKKKGLIDSADEEDDIVEDEELKELNKSRSFIKSSSSSKRIVS